MLNDKENLYTMLNVYDSNGQYEAVLRTGTEDGRSIGPNGSTLS